jgi:hypothetical protein
MNFRTNISPPLSGSEVSQVRNKQKQASLPPAYAGFLYGFPFDLEDGSDMFRQNVGLAPNFTMLTTKGCMVKR